MPIPLYPEFLSDEREYRKAEAFWREAISQATHARAQENDWWPWGSETFADGTPFPRDGNPIVGVRSARLGRALRIIQWPPVETKGREITAWLEPPDDDLPSGVDRFHELVISVLLSPESAAIARKLIDRWIDPDTSPEQMQAFISEIAPPDDQTVPSS